MTDPSTPTPSRDVRVAVPLIAATRARAAAAERPLASAPGEPALSSSAPETPQNTTLLATPDNRREAPVALPSAAGESSSPDVLRAVAHRLTGGGMGHFTSADDVEACLAGPSDSGHFVRRSVDAGVEDPFVENVGSSPTDPFCGDAEVSPLRRRAQSTTALRVPEGGMVYTPRPDRLDQQISIANAQGVFPPEACVFVANLVVCRSDEQLTESVGRVFGQFGRCYVKIRRDRNRMPFAFTQFETVDEARTAIEGSRGGMVIDGRLCRTEAAKVNRSVYLSRCDGGKVTEEEARRVLTPFGALQQTSTLSESDMEIFNLPEGIWVKFAFFQDCRDAQIAFRNNAQYRVEDPPRADEIRAQLSGARHRQALSFGPYQSPHPLPQMQYLQQQTPPGGPQPRGRRHGFSHPDISPRPARRFEAGTIWVANTPRDVTREQLVDAFSQYGLILSVDVVSREHVRRGSSNTFAFVKFQSDESVVAAVNDGHKPVLGGHHLRVERKFLDLFDRRHSRLRAAQVGHRFQPLEAESPPMPMETSPPQEYTAESSPMPNTPSAQGMSLDPAGQAVLHAIYRYAVNLGVSHELSLDMVLHLQRVNLGMSPMATPMGLDSQNPFGLVAAPQTHGQQYLAMQVQAHMPYELADTSLSQPHPRQIIMTENILPSPSPLRQHQISGTFETRYTPPHAPTFAPVQGPPVGERATPLVVSSTGPVESFLVTNLTLHTGANEVPTIPEDSQADVARTDSTHYAGDTVGDEENVDGIE